MGLLPSEEIIGLGQILLVAERRFQRRNALLRKIHLHAVAVRERVGGLGLAVVCAGRQCERTASVLPVRGLPGSIIALVVKDTADGVSSQILKGAQVTVMESDSAVSVIETGSFGQRTQQMLDHLADKVNGVILSTDAPSISFIRDYAKRVPLVVLNRPLEGVASVVPDPRIGTVRAEPAETLPSHRGHVRCRPGRVMGQSVEVAAVHDIGNRMGFKVNQIGPVHPTVEGGYQAALALEGGDTTAIITYNDLIAVGIVLRFTADGVNVPGDVSVIGFDNTLIAPVVTPPITSIRIPRAQLGQVAVRHLLLMMISPMILLGVFLTFGVSRLLSGTLLRGVPSSFTLELPPYRRPRIGQVVVRSVLDRTLFVLGRAAAVAAPAGLLIWLCANVQVGGDSILNWCTGFLDPFARLLGLDGVILMAFLLGFPANEIVIPIIIMAYLSTGSLLEFDSLDALRQLLVDHGWTWLTAVCTMLFSLMHWPCSTTCLTIGKETKSAKWTLLSIAIPTGIGMAVCFLVASAARLLGLA